MRVTFALVFWTLFLASLARADLLAQPYGLDSPQPIGAFLDGSLPNRRPGSTAEGQWRLVNAFPNLSFVNPIFLTFEPTTQRLIVIEHGGTIWAFNNDPAVTQSQRTLFLDITARTKQSIAGGIKSLAFHPQYGESGSPNRDYLYLCYRAVIPPGVREQWEVEAYVRLSRFTVSGGVINPNSEVVLIQQYDAHNWHDGGALFFGNDSFLYVSFGDLGGSNDSFDSCQIINSGLFSGVLRIDVDRISTRSHPIRRQPRNHTAPPAGWVGSFTNTSSTDGYFIPNDNPWLNPNGSVLEEFYAIGLRSPHRMTIDRPTGNIWLGDVGQESREEVNLIRKGANYQWPYREGTLDGLHAPPAQILGVETPPIHEYAHGGGDGNCVIGGYVYHGQQFATQLGGKYIFADNGSQSVFALTYISGQPPVVEHLVTGPNGNEMSGISSLGETAQGELYFLKLNGFEVPGATILKLEPEMAPAMAPPLLSQTGAFTNLSTLQARSGLIPYDVNNALWSDGALKRRWLAIPNDGVVNTSGERIAFSENSEWDFPIGTVFMKHFMFPTDERDPSVLRWLETRFLVRGIDDQFYGLTYHWRPDRSDADLLPDGLDEPHSLTHADGSVEPFNWHYPSRTECLTCHSYAARHVLGLNTHQLNRPYTYELTGRTDNELRTLNHLGFLYPPVLEADIPSFLASSPLSDGQAPVEDRVRSYLDSNCSQCHRPGGVQAHFDTRLVTPLAQQNIINGPVENTLGIDGARVVVPQDLSRSLLLERLSSLEICCAMPPLAKNRLDSNAIDLVSEWIEGLDPSTGGLNCPCRLWDDATVPAIPAASDNGAVELGLKFETQVNGYIQGIRFYKGSGNNGQHRGNLWRSDGTLLATTLFSGETATGWQTASFSAAVPIVSGTTYVASYYAPVGRYGVTLDYFATAGVIAPPLEAPASTDVGGNGVYRYGASSFPNQSYRSANYWVDVAFTDSLPDTTPPQVTSTSPSSGATNVNVATLVSATFNESLDSSTVTASTFVLRDASGTPVAALVTYDGPSATASLDPNSSLLSGVTYTATLTGGSSGVKDLAGNALASNFSWSFTTASLADTTPPQVTSTSPSSGATNVNVATLVSATFNESLDSSTVTASTFVLRDASGTPVAALVTYDGPSATASLDPNSSLLSGVTYTATLTGGSSGVKDLAGNALASNFSWSFTTASLADTTPPQVTSTSPSSGATNVNVATLVSATFNESLDSSTVTASTFVLRDASGTPVAALVTYDGPSATASLDPNSSLLSGVTYTATLTGGSSGVKDLAGNALASNFSWSFTTASLADTTPPQVTSTSPSSGATNVNVATLVSATFNESLDSSTVTASTFVLRDASGTPVAALVTYDGPSATASLDPNSSLLSGVTYTATLTGGSSGVKDLAGNALASNFSWSFTTASPPPTSQTIWSPSTVPTIVDSGDSVSYELGVKFRAQVSGQITGIRFYKSAANGGTHSGSLWTTAGVRLATVNFTGETASGWQQALFASPVTIQAGVIYVASYFDPQGRYSFSFDYFATGGFTSNQLEAIGAPESSNGVYRAGTTSGFPNQSYRSANYWVDVVFSPGSTSDTTPPQVLSTVPSSGATNVDVATLVSATFSESLNSSTVTGTTFVLRDAAGATVPAAVTYDNSSATATLDPSSSLLSGVTYTATLTGGTSGVKDLAGNALASNVSWSFTTATVPPPPTGQTIWSSSTVPAVVDSADPAPYELGVKFRAQVSGQIAGIRFYKSAANGGTHTGSLWTTAGFRLATVNFTGETASGWQQALFASPVSIQAGVIYVASYFDPQGRYSYNLDYFATGGFTSNQLEAIGAPESPNGVYRAGTTSGFPNQSNRAANYWVDVVFSPGSTSDTTPPQVLSTVPSSGATNVDVATLVSATFSEGLNPSTVSASTFVLRDPSGGPVVAAVTYDNSSATATLDPNSSLLSGVTYTATLTGGASGVKDLAGNALASNFSWSFTTTATPPPPPTSQTIWSSSVVPAIIDSADAGPYELGVKFRTSVNGQVKGVRFYKGAANTGTHVGHLWTLSGTQLGSVTFTSETSSGWQQALFATPISIQAGQIYVISCFMPKGHYSLDIAYFNAGGITSGALTAVGASESPNGVYKKGSSGFPTSNYANANYWVDLLFE